MEQSIGIALYSFFLLGSFVGTAQEVRSDMDKEAPISIENRANELKVGAVKLLAGPILDLEYERILSKFTSYGGNIVVQLEKNTYLYDFSISPFFRMYFTETKEYGSKGFFAQAFIGYYWGEGQYYDIHDDIYYFDGRTKRFNVFGTGFGIGKKWVNKQGFVLQILMGGGRTIGGKTTAPGELFHGDVAVGYRF